MENVIDVAKYLISIDKSKYFNKSKIKYNGKSMSKGSFCQQKIIYFANIFHLIINGEKLVDDSALKPLVNGPVFYDLWEEKLLKKDIDWTVDSLKLSDESRKFLDAINNFFVGAEASDLYELSHSDIYYLYAIDNKKEKIDIRKNIDINKKEYEPALKLFVENFYVKNI